MEQDRNNNWLKWIKQKSEDKPESAQRLKYPKSEKITVFLIAFGIALGLWLLVNLGREYTLTVEIPLQISEPEEDYALVEQPPKTATVTILGEGWNLLNVYNNPPSATIRPESDYIDLLEVIQDQMTAHPDLSVQKVEPASLMLTVEERVTRTVPIQPEVNISFRRQFNFKGSPSINPDSVTISGARSLVENIDELTTRSYEFSEVDENLDLELELKPPSDLLQLDRTKIKYYAEVAEYTEAEVRLLVRVRNKPEGEEVRFTPSVITVRYDVPLEQFALAQEQIPYEAYVYYDDIEEDTTGVVSPVISATMEDLDLRLRSYQPRRVSYYIIVDE